MIKRFEKFNENISHDDELKINGSGLFFFNSRLDSDTKLQIINWYNNLSTEDKKFVDILRSESSDESEYFSKNED